MKRTLPNDTYSQRVNNNGSSGAVKGCFYEYLMFDKTSDLFHFFEWSRKMDAKFSAIRTKRRGKEVRMRVELMVWMIERTLNVAYHIE